MSDTDSFIEEVSEEVRRDNLFRLFRKYGWIGIASVVLLVGGASYNEWSKSRARTAAEQAGDNILAALESPEAKDRLAALSALSEDGDRGAALQLLVSGEALASDDRDRAIQALSDIAGDAGLPVTYRHLAELKLLLINGADLPPDERISRLQVLAAPGAPYRLLAEEQIGLAQVAAGDTPAALDSLQAILADAEVTQGQRRRVAQLIIALGGEIDAV